MDFKWKLIDKPDEEPSLLDSVRGSIMKQFFPERASLDE